MCRLPIFLFGGILYVVSSKVRWENDVTLSVIEYSLENDADSIEFQCDSSDDDVYNSGEEDNMQNTRLLIAKSAEKEK